MMINDDELNEQTRAMVNTLLPCPFCGTDKHLVISESARIDKRRVDSIGRTTKHINIIHRVECAYCGATGSHSFDAFDRSEYAELTNELVNNSIAAAALAWNKRHQISDEAFRLVNDLIHSCVKAIREKNA